MGSNDIGYVLLGNYIVTGDARDTGLSLQYPCIGLTATKSTVSVYTYSQECADAIEKRMAAWKSLSHSGVPMPVKYGWENGRFMVAVEQELYNMLPLKDKRFDVEFYPMEDNTLGHMLTYAGYERLLKSAEVLSYMASQGFIYGCVTPENILCGDEEVFLSEFLMLRNGCVPAYCSMEQVSDTGAITYKTDVYSWAVSVMELYLGERPWRSGIAAGRKADEYLERAERTRGMPSDMSRLLDRCLNMDPDARPDWIDIVDTIRGWLDKRDLTCSGGVAAASDPNKTVLDRSENEITQDTSKTVYLSSETEADQETTSDGKYCVGRRIELDPPFEIYEANEIASGKAVTLLRLTPEKRGNEAAKERLFKRYINSLSAAYDGLSAAYDESIEPDHTCEYIVRWNDPTFADKDDIEYLIADTPYGKSLSVWGQENVPLDETMALYLIGRLFRALKATHSSGMKYMGQGDFIVGTGAPLVHRSVSISNIRIIERKAGKLPILMLDGFETAVPVKKEAESLGRSQCESDAISYCGAPAFSPRQQLVYADDPDYAWDVWASAACLYYMLTGGCPRDLSGNTWDALLHNNPIPIRKRRSDVSLELAKVIDRALDDSEMLHYPDILSFWQDIIGANNAGDDNEKDQPSAPEEDGNTVFDSGAAKPDNDRTVFEDGKTVFDSTATQLDDGSTTIAALSDAPEQANAPESNVSFEKGSTILDTYRVESDPIHGGMGSVWRVHHTGWNTDLAMKRPKPELFQNEKQKAMFIGECDAWINLGLHPNIVSCYYVREISGTPSIFSEWMDGGSLEGAIHKGTLYEGSEAEQQARILDIVIQFARGLHYAHENGLIHQDVKPDNLLLTKEGDAKVADFGIAKARATLTVLGADPAIQGNADGTLLSASGGYTPAYCSMEQMDGKALTRRTDIYSWAVSVMEMYMGSRPWANGVVAGLSCRDYFEDARVPMPETMQKMLARCMETEPDDRPHDFAEIESALLEIYKAATGGDYPRPEPKAAGDTADSLNNRALSYLDLGMPEEAEKLWDKAQEGNPNDATIAFNRALFSWRQAKMTDVEAVAYLENTAIPTDPLRETYGGLLYAESGRYTRAESSLKCSEAVDMAAFRQQVQAEIDRIKGKGEKTYVIDEGNMTRRPRFHAALAALVNGGSRLLYGMRDSDVLTLKRVGVSAYSQTQHNTLAAPPKRIIANASGSLAACAGESKKVELWRIEPEEALARTWEADAAALCFAGENRLWLADAAQNNLRLYGVDTEEPLAVCALEGGMPQGMTAAGGRLLCWRSAPNDTSLIEVRDIMTGRLLYCFPWERSVCEAHIQSGADRATLCDGKHQCAGFELVSGRCLWKWDTGKNPAKWLTVAPDGLHALALLDDNGLLVELPTGRVLHTMDSSELLGDYKRKDMLLSGKWVYNAVWLSNSAVYALTILEQSRTFLPGDKTTTLFGEVWPIITEPLQAPYSLRRVYSTKQRIDWEREMRLHAQKAQAALAERDIPLALAEIVQARELPGFEQDGELLALNAQIGQHCSKVGLGGAIETEAADFVLPPSYTARDVYGEKYVVDDKGTISVTDGNGRPLCRPFTPDWGGERMMRCWVSPDDPALACVFYNKLEGRVELWNYRSGRMIWKRKAAVPGMYAVAFLPGYAAVATPMGKGLLVSLSTGQVSYKERLFPPPDLSPLAGSNAELFGIRGLAVGQSPRFWEGSFAQPRHDLRYCDFTFREPSNSGEKPKRIAYDVKTVKNNQLIQGFYTRDQDVGILMGTKFSMLRQKENKETFARHSPRIERVQFSRDDRFALCCEGLKLQGQHAVELIDIRENISLLYKETNCDFAVFDDAQNMIVTYGSSGRQAWQLDWVYEYRGPDDPNAACNRKKPEPDSGELWESDRESQPHIDPEVDGTEWAAEARASGIWPPQRKQPGPSAHVPGVGFAPGAVPPPVIRTAPAPAQKHEEKKGFLDLFKKKK